MGLGLGLLLGEDGHLEGLELEAEGLGAVGVVVDDQADGPVDAAADHGLHALGQDHPLEAGLVHGQRQDSGQRGVVGGGAQVVDAAVAVVVDRHGGEGPVEGIVVAQEDLGGLRDDHIPEDTGRGLAFAHQGDAVVLLDALSLLHVEAQQLGHIHGDDLAEGQVVVPVLDGGPVGDHGHAAAADIVAEPLDEVGIGDNHMGDDHQLVAGEVGPGGKNVHHLAAAEEDAVKPLHLVSCLMGDSTALASAIVR